MPNWLVGLPMFKSHPNRELILYRLSPPLYSMKASDKTPNGLPISQYYLEDWIILFSGQIQSFRSCRPAKLSIKLENLLGKSCSQGPLLRLDYGATIPNSATDLRRS